MKFASHYFVWGVLILVQAMLLLPFLVLALLSPSLASHVVRHTNCTCNIYRARRKGISKHIHSTQISAAIRFPNWWTPRARVRFYYHPWSLCKWAAFFFVGPRSLFLNQRNYYLGPAQVIECRQCKLTLLWVECKQRSFTNRWILNRSINKDQMARWKSGFDGKVSSTVGNTWGDQLSYKNDYYKF